MWAKALVALVIVAVAIFCIIMAFVVPGDDGKK